MRRKSLFSELLIACYLIAKSGLTFGQNADQLAPKTRDLKSTESEENVFNPLEELLGFRSPLLPDFEEDISKTLEEHRQAMDRAMNLHKQVMDNHKDNLDSMIEEQQRDMEQFHEHFKNLEKDFNEEFNPMNEAFEQMAAPYMVPFIAPLNDQPLKIEPKKNATKTELPVFHPMAEPVLNTGDDIFGSLFEDFQPVLKELHNDVQKRKNQSEKARQQKPDEEQMPFDFFGWDSNENLTEANNETKTSDGGLVSDFLGSLVDSFERIFINNADHNKDNKDVIADKDSENSTSENAMKQLDEPEKDLDQMKDKHMNCGCPQAMIGIHEEDCPMKKEHDHTQRVVSEAEKDEEFTNDLQDMANALDMYRATGLMPIVPDVFTRREKSLNKLWDIENRLEDGLRKAWKANEEAKGQSPTPASTLAIEQQLKHEIKIVTKDDDDYEWYDWTLIGLIAGTSSVLMAIVMFSCVQKTLRSKKVKLQTKSVEDGLEPVVRLKTKKADADCVANDNVSNKYTEKIKTIFVNLK